MHSLEIFYQKAQKISSLQIIQSFLPVLCAKNGEIIVFDGAEMLLSCPAKKVTKECGIGEALSVSLLRAEPMNYGMIATGNHV